MLLRSYLITMLILKLSCTNISTDSYQNSKMIRPIMEAKTRSNHNSMETRSSKRKKLLLKTKPETDPSDIDRLSDLPDAVLHRILCLLPIKSIAQTCVLSKRWSSIWSSFPDLDFTTVSNPYPNPATNKSKIFPFSPTCEKVEFIHDFLSLRDRNSDLRILKFRARLSFTQLNSLIRSALRKNVQELDLEITTNDHFNLPRCVATSDTLRVLKLKSFYPGFRLPPSPIMSAGFKSLHALSLSSVILYNQPFLFDLFTESSFPRLKKLNLEDCFGLERLRVSCRALEELALERCFQLCGLEISCTRLESLRVANCFDAYCDRSFIKINCSKLQRLEWKCNSITEFCNLENLVSLTEASIGFNMIHKDHIGSSKLWSVSNFLGGVSGTQCLTLESQSAEILSNNSYFAVPLNPFNRLKSLELHTGFDRNNIPGMSGLFRSSPMLHTLVIKIVNDLKIERRQWDRELWEMSSSEEQFWESQTQNLKQFLLHLNIVKIYGFVECENEISLAKFLLKHGRALQEMTLFSGHTNFKDTLRREKIRSQMMGFSRASSRAKIEFH